MSQIAVGSLQERLEREARVSGLRDFRTPSLEAVERRRFQLWTVALLLLVLVTAANVTITLWRNAAQTAPWATPPALRIGILLLALGFCAYVVEKEAALRRLTAMLIDERVLTAALSNRLKELSTLAVVGRAINSVLSLEDVLNIILSSAVELLGGAEGSIMLLEEPGYLRVVCVLGNESAKGARIRLGWGIAGRVALTGEPLLLSGPADPELFPHLVERDRPVQSSVCVPLVHRGELLGVLNVSAGPDRMFTEYDLRAMTLFAEHAAISIANARLFEAEVERVAELQEVNRLKSEFVATVSHELRTPLTSILGSVITLRSVELDQGQSEEFLAAIERQGRRLLRLIEELLTAAQLQRDGIARPSPEALELTALALEVAKDFGDPGIEVVGPERCEVVSDPEILRRVLSNLIDNALKHGAAPVRVVLGRSGDDVEFAVIDHGPGIPPADCERIFERFTRLDSTGSRPGIGLGLPIVRELLSACGGRIWVEAPAEGGAAFRVALPAHLPSGARS
jgi:two-component system, OmpR family, sensor histidine kinase KdpD